MECQTVGGGAKGAAGPSPGVVGRPGRARWGGDERGGLLHTHSARSSMCEHGRQRSRCVACGGASVCKEVRWWATDRLMRGLTTNLADIRSLQPCTCWILADRGGGGVAVEGKCGVRNPQTASWSTPNMVVSPANRPGGRGDRRGYSRPARRDVPTAGVWCVPGWPVTPPPWYVTGNA